MKKSIITAGIAFVATTLPLLAQAPMLPGDPSQSPIDGGLLWLLIGGGLYGLKKMKQRQPRPGK